MTEVTSIKSFEIDEQNYELVIVSLENAVSLYVYEDKPRFGTFGVSVPSTEFMSASTLYITGQKNEQYVRMIGERLATRTKKLVLVSLNVQEITNDLLLKIIENIEKELFSKEEKE
ncbi:hypothetical protein EU534_00490 [Candidatus Heimdallarchaeota archaeon]|nr:MAG: hypothetical protein EU534_00490 [Candidatus Heimdallarchaeota archaeon]